MVTINREKQVKVFCSEGVLNPYSADPYGYETVVIKSPEGEGTFYTDGLGVTKVSFTDSRGMILRNETLIHSNANLTKVRNLETKTNLIARRMFGVTFDEAFDLYYNR